MKGWEEQRLVVGHERGVLRSDCCQTSSKGRTGFSPKTGRHWLLESDRRRAAAPLSFNIEIMDKSLKPQNEILIWFLGGQSFGFWGATWSPMEHATGKEQAHRLPKGLLNLLESRHFLTFSVKWQKAKLVRTLKRPGIFTTWKRFGSGCVLCARHFFLCIKPYF